MSRLPVPGSDDGTWGAILNDFLQVELAADGTLKRGNELDAVTAHLTDANAHGGRPPQTATFTFAGRVSIGVGLGRFYFNRSSRLVSVRIAAGTAPVGAALICDVNCNGATIFATQANRPTIASGTHTALAGTSSVLTFGQGDYLTIDVDQVGSTLAGTDLTVMVEYSID